MKKVLALTFVTFAIAAVVTGMTAITTAQIVNATSQGNSDDNLGDYMRDKAQCDKNNDCEEDDEGRADNPPDNPAKNWGESVSEATDNDDLHNGISDFRANGCKIHSNGQIDRTGNVCN